MVFEKGMCSTQSSTMTNNAMVDGNDNGANKVLSVLVVDDDNFVREIHKMFMINLGMEVQVAKNGKEAVDLHCSGASFNLILMDMEMPIMNGREATKELRAMGVNSCIIGVTSSDSEIEHKAFMAAGLNDCIVKPLNFDKIALILPMLNTNKNN